MKNNKDVATNAETDVRERIKRILRAKNINATQLAERMGIAPAVLSHVMSGRNEPSSSFFIKLKKLFPEYNLEWLMLGTLPITSSGRYHETSNIEYQKMVSEKSETTPVAKTNLFDGKSDGMESADDNSLSEILSGKRVVKLIVVYSDNTFDELKPSAL